MKKRILFSVIFLMFSASFCSSKDGGGEKIWGVTIDDSWYEEMSAEEVVSSLRSFRVRPTVRIVMSKDREPREYISLFQKIHQAADIMAEPVDSFEMALYEDVQSYRERFADSYRYLGDYVDIWEIGNEVNGKEWIGQSDELIIAKITAAYDVFKDTDEKTALTFYYEKPGSRQDMLSWISEYVPLQLRENIDYSFISYYEDENEGYEPDWKTVFKSFQALFPKSGVGIGECGNITEDADEESKIRMIDKYYQMPALTENYVGGYFWWNYVADCVPNSENKVCQAIYRHFK